MFREKQTPEAIIPPKKCSANAKHKPQETTHTEEWSPQSCICNSIEIKPCTGSCPQIGCTFTKHSLRRNLRRDASVLIFNLRLRFCQKKLFKSKNSWDHWYLVIILGLWLLKMFVYIIWQNFLAREKKY